MTWELTQLIDRTEQFRHLVRKFEEKSGESVTDNVRQAVFQAGIKGASIRDHLALLAGRLNSFDEMATEVSTVARARNSSRVKERARTARAKTVRARTVRRRGKARMARTMSSPSRRVRTRTKSVSTVTRLAK